MEKHPAKFKEIIDRLVEDHEELNESSQRTKKEVQKYEQRVDQFILKTVFMYFFELMGIQRAQDLEAVLEKLPVFSKE